MHVIVGWVVQFEHDDRQLLVALDGDYVDVLVQVARDASVVLVTHPQVARDASVVLVTHPRSWLGCA